MADFVGKSNFFSGRVATANGTAVDVTLDCGETIQSTCLNNPPNIACNEKVSVSIRPEQLVAVRDSKLLSESAGLKADATVVNRIFLGEHTEYLLRNESLGDFLVLTPRQNELNQQPLDIGERVFVACSREGPLVLAES